MQTRESFPRATRCLSHVKIPLPDGTRLAARVWLPVDAETDPVPAIIDAVPYRLTDGFAQRDAAQYPYLAGHGYAAVRIDLRGSGDSDGVLLDEYLSQELDDLVNAIAWVAEQPWCTGSVGMTGVSWGGINSLLVAARRPPQLKAIVTVCSTDDRYLDDVHYRGGGLLALDMSSWGATMLHLGALPPHPHVAGPEWREIWRERLEAGRDWTETWLRHQRRDDYWRRSSLSAEYSAIAVPVYAVGGWADGYTDAVLRLLERVPGVRKGLIGPWAHRWPQDGVPGPAIGFLQEMLRWWDQWLKGIDTGIMDEPMLRVWMQEHIPPSPAVTHQAGRWVTEDAWPSPYIDRREWSLCASTGGSARVLVPHSDIDDAASSVQFDALAALGSGPAVDALAGRARADAGGGPRQCETDGMSPCDPFEMSADVMAPAVAIGVAQDAMAPVTPPGPPSDAFAVASAPPRYRACGEGEVALVHSSPQLTGLDAGAWCMTGQPGDWPPDQRAEDGRSLTFDSMPLNERLELFGHVEVRLALAADRPVANIAVRLCDVAEDGSSKLVTRGVLNLTHRDGHERPEPIEPDRRYSVALRLDAIAHAVPAGHKLRIGVSTAYWPWIWPAPEPVTLTLFAGPESVLSLPVRSVRESDAARSAFPEPEQAPPLESTEEGEAGGAYLRVRDLETDSAALEVTFVDGPTVRFSDPTDDRPVEIAVRDTAKARYSITEGDPLSARVESYLTTDLFSDAGLAVRVETRTTLWADAHDFHLSSDQRVTQDGEELHLHRSEHTIPRDLM